MTGIACGSDSVMVLTQFDEALITSPNFPNPYPPNSNCTWIITAADDAEIQLSLKGHKLKQKYVYTPFKSYMKLDIT